MRLYRSKLSINYFLAHPDGSMSVSYNKGASWYDSKWTRAEADLFENHFELVNSNISFLEVVEMNRLATSTRKSDLKRLQYETLQK